MGTLIEKCFGFSQIKEELEARIGELENENDKLFAENESLSVKISGLENANDQLWQAKENLTKEKTELIEKIKALSTERDKLIASYQDKSDLDLDNRLLASANQDLKRQNRKLEEENMALKERGLKEQPSKQQKS
ncbi:transcriptional regulator [Helicobacter pylori]|uniref:transcriptional regulator n=1 Tax=Helicobacter pylori TaxID=210 RepID=UPI000FDF5343|nr:transcriptional regulator [Helicobacter pylori]RVZ83406.1 transcriptional regulator [Helicobacter pylori]